MAKSESEDEDEFFDAFDPSLPSSLTKNDHNVIELLSQELGTLSIEIPQQNGETMRSSSGLTEHHILEIIQSKVPFAGNGSGPIPVSGEEAQDPADRDELTLDLTPYFNEKDSDLKVRTRSISRPSSFHPAVETIEEDVVDTESFDHHSSDKDSSVPSVADTNSETSAGSKSLLSRFRRAVGAVNFTASPLKSLPSQPPEIDPSPLKTPKRTPTAAGFFANPFLFSGKAATVYDRLSETQRLGFHQQAVWVTAFSLDGKFLATGGKDGRVVVWSVGIDRRGVSDQDITRDGRSDSVTTVDEETLMAFQATPFPLIFPIPCRVYRDHTDDITDISWTRRHFLLSASADKTVRLWNVKRVECLQKFEHPDVVTSVQFHPIRERFFVSGCFDGLVRVWDLIKEDKTEIASAEHTDLVTAVCFSPDGLYVAAGLIDGHVFLYETADLKYYTQIACIRKNKKLSARDKRKVTGVSFIASRGPSALVGGDLSTGSGGGGRRPVTTTKDKYHLLVTTNDSRIRLFSMSDFTLLLKLKGPTNSSRQIRASGSLDGRSIICGSDTGDVFIWKLPAHPSTPTTASAPATTTATEDSAVRIGSDGEAAAARVALPSLPLSPSSSLLVECHVIPAQLKTATLSVDLPSSAASSSAGTASSGKELYPPCTATLLVPLNAIHLSHTAAGHSNGSEDTTSSLRNASKITGAGSGSRYSAKDLSCLAILTAEYDGSLHVLYTPG